MKTVEYHVEQRTRDGNWEVVPNGDFDSHEAAVGAMSILRRQGTHGPYALRVSARAVNADGSLGVGEVVAV